MWNCREKPHYCAMLIVAASVGGVGDFVQRSGWRFCSESRFGFQSLEVLPKSTDTLHLMLSQPDDPIVPARPCPYPYHFFFDFSVLFFVLFFISPESTDESPLRSEIR